MKRVDFISCVGAFLVKGDRPAPEGGYMLTVNALGKKGEEDV